MALAAVERSAALSTELRGPRLSVALPFAINPARLGGSRTRDQLDGAVPLARHGGRSEFDASTAEVTAAPAG